jgi:hypothetical protein
MSWPAGTIGETRGIFDRVETIGEESPHFGIAFEMTFRVLSEEFAGGIEMGVLADAGENIEHLPATGAGVLDPVGGDNRQAKLFRKIAKLLVDPLFAAQKVALDFNVDVFLAERVDD